MAITGKAITGWPLAAASPCGCPAGFGSGLADVVGAVSVDQDGVEGDPDAPAGVILGVNGEHSAGADDEMVEVDFLADG